MEDRQPADPHLLPKLADCKGPESFKHSLMPRCVEIAVSILPSVLEHQDSQETPLRTHMTSASFLVMDWE